MFEQVTVTLPLKAFEEMCKKALLSDAAIADGVAAQLEGIARKFDSGGKQLVEMEQISRLLRKIAKRES